ncbi:EamA family transporter [Haladaptatus sp. DJG-WS-42]|uniref:DMT family transporter n=1 Tax=Haladaptatus sp. DJG-WS-42 TaxID=3120516 RepID=UPI0030D3E30A
MRYRNLLLFVFLAAIWGSAFMAIKAGLEFFPPVLFAALRYDIAAVFMLAYAVYVTDHWLPRTRAEWWLVVVGSVLLIAGYHIFLFVGETQTTSAAAAVIISLSPILTTTFARALLPSQRLTAAGVAGMVIALLGVAILARPDPANLLTEDVVAKGLVFLAAVSFSFGSVLTRRIDARLPIETMEAWSMLGGAILMHAVSLALPNESLGDIVWTNEGLLALAYLSLVASAIGFLIYFDLLERLGPVEINLVSYVAPIFAALSGFLFLQEGLDRYTVAGFLVIFTGFLLLKGRDIRTELLGTTQRDGSTD